MGEALFTGWRTQDQAFDIAPPRLSDIPQLLVTAKALALTPEGWRSLIASGSVVAAKSQTFSGLYVADHYSFAYEGERLQELRAARSVLCNRFKLEEESVGFGAEVVIAAEWQIGDLRAHLLRALLRNVGLHYRHLFRFCRKDNPAELETLKGEGWRCFQEEEENCYLMLDVAKALRGLASRLVLRLQPRRVTGGARVGRQVS